VSSLVSRFPLLVLLGLGLGLHPVANGAETEAGRMTLRCDVVVGAALVMLAHPIDLAAVAFPILRQTDLGAGRAVRRYNRKVVLMPSLIVSVPSSPPDLDRRPVDDVFLPKCWLAVPAMGSPRWQINHLQAYSDGIGGAAVRSFWLLCFGSRSGVGGSLSFSPFFCESVGLLVSISDGGGGLFFRPPVVRQPAAEDSSSSPFRHRIVADTRSTCMMWRGGVVAPWILRHQQCLKPSVRIGGGFRCASDGFSVDGLERLWKPEFACVNSMFSRVCDVKERVMYCA
jgi:hypothetical protein